MRTASTPMAQTAGVLVFVAVLIWSMVGVVTLRRRAGKPGRESAPVVLSAPARRPEAAVPPPLDAPSPPQVPVRKDPPPVRTALPSEDARQLLQDLRRTRGQGGREKLFRQLEALQLGADLLSEVKAFIREELGLHPGDAESLGLLACFGSDLGFDAALEFTGPGESKEVRLEALRLACERTSTPQQQERMQALFLSETDEDARITVLLGAEKACPPLSAALVRRALTDASEPVRALAAGSLEAARDEDRGLLIGLAGSDPAEAVRGNALILLRVRMSDPAVVELMLAQATREPSAENRKEAVQALGSAGMKSDPRALDTLQAVSRNDASEDVRAAARKSMALLQSSR